MTKKPPLILVDGSSYLYRAYHALPPLTNREGEPTGAVYGVIQMLRKLIKTYQPHYMAVVLDSKEPTFRHALYPDYKANRPPMPEDLRPQWQRFIEVLPLLGIHCLKESGLEADDLMATWAVMAKQAGFEVLISSGDKDMVQLVSPGITVVDTMSQRTYDREKVIEKFGVPPEQIPDYLALMGDKIDHVPGVPGVGPKTAAKWLQTYGDLQGIMAAASEIKGKVGEALRASIDSLPLSLQLVTLKTDCPQHYQLSDLAREPEQQEDLKAMWQTLGFHRLLREYETDPAAAMMDIPLHTAQATDHATEQEMGAQYPLIFLDALGVPIGGMTWVEGWQNPDCTKIGYDLKTIWHQLSLEHPELLLQGPYEDIRLMAHTLHSELPIDLVQLSERMGRAPHDVLGLYQTLKAELSHTPSVKAVYETIEKPLLPILWQMEKTGVLLDVERLKVQGQELDERLAVLQAEAHRLAGMPFNLDSPKQLRAILFEKEGCPIIEKTPKGEPSTNERVLTELALQYPIASVILSHRTLMKLKTTYVDKLPLCINPATGRLHARFDQSGTVTGRFSCSEPNLQNIPIRTDEGRRIRDAFIARDGWRILACDYSQIELRIMAHLSGEPRLLAAFERGEDIHRQTAAEIFGVPQDEVSPSQRRSAKAINFGLIYGMSAFGLAAQLGVARQEAEGYLKRYFERYPRVKAYMTAVEEQANAAGFVETIAGRRLYLPDIRAKNIFKRKASIRAAVNAPMQGSAADIIKKAMLAVSSGLVQDEAVLIMQVHDELVFEVRSDRIEFYIARIREAMVHALSLQVPLEVGIGIGRHWGEAH